MKIDLHCHSKYSGDNHLEPEDLIAQAIKMNLDGICVPSHPFRGYDSFGEHVLEMEGFDALETHNGINSEEMNRKAIRSAVMRNLPSIGGSDCHSREQVGRAFTEFKNPVSTVHALIEEIKNGNCRGVIVH